MDVVSEEESENQDIDGYRIQDTLHELRWPKVVGLEHIFQDMEIAEEPGFLNIQEPRAGTADSMEIDSQGK